MDLLPSCRLRLKAGAARDLLLGLCLLACMVLRQSRGWLRCEAGAPPPFPGSALCPSPLGWMNAPSAPGPTGGGQSRPRHRREEPQPRLFCPGGSCKLLRPCPCLPAYACCCVLHGSAHLAYGRMQQSLQKAISEDSNWGPREPLRGREAVLPSMCNFLGLSGVRPVRKVPMPHKSSAAGQSCMVACTG